MAAAVSQDERQAALVTGSRGEEGGRVKNHPFLVIQSAWNDGYFDAQRRKRARSPLLRAASPPPQPNEKRKDPRTNEVAAIECPGHAIF